MFWILVVCIGAIIDAKDCPNKCGNWEKKKDGLWGHIGKNSKKTKPHEKLQVDETVSEEWGQG